MIDRGEATTRERDVADGLLTAGIRGRHRAVIPGSGVSWAALARAWGIR